MSAAPRVLRSDPAGDAQPSTCTDCGGRGWRRSQGACLVRDVRALAAENAELRARVAVLESSELLAWARREWDEAVHPASADVASRVDKLERALSEIGVIVMRGW